MDMGDYLAFVKRPLRRGVGQLAIMARYAAGRILRDRIKSTMSAPTIARNML